MELRFKIKPTIIKGITIGEVKREITSRSRSYTISDYQQAYATSNANGDVALVYNIVVKNRVVEQTKVWNDKSQRMETKSKLISPKVVTGYVYYIPVEILKIMRFKVIQRKRNFIMEPIRK